MKPMMKVKKPNVPKLLYTKNLSQAKKNIPWIFETNIEHFEFETNHNVQYDYDSKLFLPK